MCRTPGIALSSTVLLFGVEPRLQTRPGAIALPLAYPSSPAVIAVSAHDTSRARLEIEQLERGWARANLRRNTAYVARILADDFVMPTETGGAIGKRQVLDGMRARRDSVTATRLDGLRVRFLRLDLALVESLYI